MTGPPLNSEDLLRIMADFKTKSLESVRTWKPPPSRAWVYRYNTALRHGYSEKFATIFADQFKG